MNKPRHSQNRGFSLIELTVALLIVVLLAGIALRSTNELSFQVRYEQTQERLNRIKEAIVGNPSRTVNGQPDISGFVADMGRLPNNIHELLERDYCFNDRSITDSPTCTANYGINAWITQTIAAADTAYNTGLRYGWRGPYLNISGNPSANDAFVDGWGHEAGVTTDQNYAWRVTAGLEQNTSAPHPVNTNRLVVQSYGKDHAAGGNDYDADYPINIESVDDSTPYTYPKPLVDQEDWLMDISQGIYITLIKEFGDDSFCGFLSSASFTTEQNCLNAGGSWSGSVCSLNVSSCKSAGGRWQSCFFSPSACAGAGGAAVSQCQFTEKSCNAADGDPDADWDGINHNCSLDNSSCTAAGGTWNGTQCNFTEPQCHNAGGAWINDCTFTNGNCTTAGGTWESTITPNSCSFTQTACHAKNGQSAGNDCYMSHAEFSGARYDAEGCQTATGQWTSRICLNLFYRAPGTSTLTYVSSAPVTINANGAAETLRFTIADANDVDGDTNIIEPMPWVALGLNAVSIHEYDGDCNSVNNPYYPAGKTQPMAVVFNPRSQLPILNW
jgi:prepilin-type N-terminal cleavage/methylation domain-containing protein